MWMESTIITILFFSLQKLDSSVNNLFRNFMLVLVKRWTKGEDGSSDDTVNYYIRENSTTLIIGPQGRL